MITQFSFIAASNRGAGMALNGFILFIGASIGPLIATEVPNFVTLLVGAALTLLLAAFCVAGSASLTSSPLCQHSCHHLANTPAKGIIMIGGLHAVTFGKRQTVVSIVTVGLFITVACTAIDNIAMDIILIFPLVSLHQSVAQRGLY